MEQWKLELELIIRTELILEHLIRKLELKRETLIIDMKLIPEPGCTQELGEKLGSGIRKN